MGGITVPRIRSNLVVVYPVRPVADDFGKFTRIEFLLLQRPEGHAFAGDWQAVGGHIREKEGETAARAAIRELAEETALPVERWFALGRIEQFYAPHNDGVYLVPAFAALVPPLAEPRISEEHQAWRWDTPHSASLRVSWPNARESIRMIADALADATRPGGGLAEFRPEELP